MIVRINHKKKLSNTLSNGLVTLPNGLVTLPKELVKLPWVSNAPERISKTTEIIMYHRKDY